MRIECLKCVGFRNLSPLEYRPSAGINVIHGANAQGKTSVLEALHYAATSKSHRTNNEAELAQHGRDDFQIRVEAVRDHGETVTLEANWWRGVKRFKVNGVAQTRISDILGKIYLVFFSPEDVGIVRGGASFRRRFMDMELSQISASYLHALQQYRHLLRQRNELLRGRELDLVLLDVWDEQLAGYAVELMDARRRFSGQLDGFARHAYQAIAQGETLDLIYAPNIRNSADALKGFRESRETDLKRGLTSRGPHRDEIEILLDSKSARRFASQGQQRSVALALKLAEIELVIEQTGEQPVVMLDDVLAELDQTRSRRLLEALRPQIQCLLTTTAPPTESSILTRDPTFFQMKAGILSQEAVRDET